MRINNYKKKKNDKTNKPITEHEMLKCDPRSGAN